MRCVCIANRSEVFSQTPTLSSGGLERVHFAKKRCGTLFNIVQIQYFAFIALAEWSQVTRICYENAIHQSRLFKIHVIFWSESADKPMGGLVF
jgi:hypothetical protein